MPDEQTHLPVFKQMLELASERTQKHVASLEADLKWRNTANNEFAAQLGERTHGFLLTGIATPGDSNFSWVSWGYRSHFTWYSYFRALCKQVHRPFVYLTGNYLTVERRRYTDPLIAPFLLAGVGSIKTAVHRHQPYTTWRNDGVVDVWSYPSKWVVRVNNGDGNELLRVWREQCKTDKGMRRALRLDSYFKG